MGPLRTTVFEDYYLEAVFASGVATVLHVYDGADKV